MNDVKPPSPTQRNIYVPADRLSVWSLAADVARLLHKSQSEFVTDALAHHLTRYPLIVDQAEGRAPQT